METLFYTELRVTAIWMPTDEKDGLTKMASSLERVLFWWTDVCNVGLSPFRGMTKSARLIRKGPDNEAWTLAVLEFDCHCVSQWALGLQRQREPLNLRYCHCKILMNILFGIIIKKISISEFPNYLQLWDNVQI